MAKVLIPQKHALTLMGVGHVTAWRWRRDGVGPRWAKMGSRVLYDLDALETFIANRLDACSGSTQEAA